MWHATRMSHLPPGAPPYPPQPGVNAYAVLALPLAVCIPVAGVTLGHVARHQIRATGERGAGLALAALLIGYGISVLWLVLIAAAILA